MIETPEGFAQFLAEKLEQDRRYAEARMRDTCLVEYDTGEVVRNPATFKEEPVWETRFESKCRIKDPGYADSDQQVGGRREAAGAAQVHLPWDSPKVYADDRITVTAIGPLTPARLLHKSFFVSTNHDRSDATATRLVVKEDPGQSA